METSEDRAIVLAKRKKAVANAAYSMRLEGFLPDPEAQVINDLYVRGEIDTEEQERRILELVGQKTK